VHTLALYEGLNWLTGGPEAQYDFCSCKCQHAPRTTLATRNTKVELPDAQPSPALYWLVRVLDDGPNDSYYYSALSNAAKYLKNIGYEVGSERARDMIRLKEPDAT